MQSIQQFIRYLQVEKRCSDHTLIAYEEDLNQFCLFSGIKVDSEWNEISHQLIRAWIVNLIETKNTNRTVSRKLSALRSFFKWLVQFKKIEVNPMLRVRAPKIEKRLPQFAKESEMDSKQLPDLFSEDFDGRRDLLLVEVLYQTGIRLSELINLKETDVNPSAIKVLGKRNKERLIPISSDLFQLVLSYRSQKPDTPDAKQFLFVSKKGLKLNEKFVYRKINTYLGTVANLQKKSPHVMRHTFATHMLNNGAGLETLKELLGHANLSATQVYTHNSFAQINQIYSQAHPRGHKNQDHGS